MKGNFSALGAKRIREKSKNDPPYSVEPFLKICSKNKNLHQK
jgi:hypothetical protein